MDLDAVDAGLVPLHLGHLDGDVVAAGAGVDVEDLAQARVDDQHGVAAGQGGGAVQHAGGLGEVGDEAGGRIRSNSSGVRVRGVVVAVEVDFEHGRGIGLDRRVHEGARHREDVGPGLGDAEYALDLAAEAVHEGHGRLVGIGALDQVELRRGGEGGDEQVAVRADRGVLDPGLRVAELVDVSVWQRGRESSTWVVGFAVAMVRPRARLRRARRLKSRSIPAVVFRQVSGFSGLGLLISEDLFALMLAKTSI